MSALPPTKREKILYMALAFYAAEDTYFATSFMFDPPCGEFRDDFSNVPESDYNRPMPGKRARQALDKYLKMLPPAEHTP